MNDNLPPRPVVYGQDDHDVYTTPPTADAVDAARLEALDRARDIINQLIACHEEPTCPAISVGREVIRMIDAAIAATKEKA